MITPITTFAARMPFPFTCFYGKMHRLDKKLQLPQQTAVLLREQVASLNTCTFCMTLPGGTPPGIGRQPARFDALPEYLTSPLFTEAERAALE